MPKPKDRARWWMVFYVCRGGSTQMAIRASKKEAEAFVKKEKKRLSVMVSFCGVNFRSWWDREIVDIAKRFSNRNHAAVMGRIKALKRLYESYSPSLD